MCVSAERGQGEPRPADIYFFIESEMKSGAKNPHGKGDNYSLNLCFANNFQSLPNIQ